MFAYDVFIKQPYSPSVFDALNAAKLNTRRGSVSYEMLVQPSRIRYVETNPVRINWERFEKASRKQTAKEERKSKYEQSVRKIERDAHIKLTQGIKQA